ncbi:MAG: HAMP domain-containing protein [Deltaproteobacteria bacterium]|nr:HAMP domain-containing protein [Deltaproteobacteria bacterium]MBN2670409.1 HAMP domain-containing protein [Deltaproteobacteria bacterium]
MLDNISIGKKIGGGFGVCIALLAILAVVSWTGFNTSGSGFRDYREIARDNVLMGRLQANLLDARLQVKNFIQTNNKQSVEQFNEHFEAVEKFAGEALARIQNPERAATVKNIASDLGVYREHFNEVVVLQGKRDELVSDLMDPAGSSAREKMTEFVAFSAKVNDTAAALSGGDLQEHFLLARIYFAKYLDSNSPSDAKRVRAEQESAEQKLEKLKPTVRTEKQQALLSDFEDAFLTYMEGFDGVVRYISERNSIIEEKLDAMGLHISEQAEQVKLSIKEEQDALGLVVQASNERSSMTILISAVVGILLAIGFAVVMARKMTGPIFSLKEVAVKVSEGDLSQEIALNQRDEVGQLATAFKQMISNLREKNAAEEANKKMVDEVIQSVADTANALQDGKLQTRAASAGAIGDYKEMLVAFNGALDAVIAPLQFSA